MLLMDREARKKKSKSLRRTLTAKSLRASTFFFSSFTRITRSPFAQRSINEIHSYHTGIVARAELQQIQLHKRPLLLLWNYAKLAHMSPLFFAKEHRKMQLKAHKQTRARVTRVLSNRHSILQPNAALDMDGEGVHRGTVRAARASRVREWSGKKSEKYIDAIVQYKKSIV